MNNDDSKELEDLEEAIIFKIEHDLFNSRGIEEYLKNSPNLLDFIRMTSTLTFRQLIKGEPEIKVEKPDYRQLQDEILDFRKEYINDILSEEAEDLASHVFGGRLKKSKE